jgi:hypothetical protein
MEIINHGTDDINQMAALSCCWPPGTETYSLPTED